MRRLIVALALLATPALAQEAPKDTPAPDTEEEQHALPPFLQDWADRTEDLMKEFKEKVGPEMEKMMAEIMPELERLGEAVGGLSNYQMPEFLPNGDIIIRRKPDAPPLPDDFQDREPEEPIDL